MKKRIVKKKAIKKVLAKSKAKTTGKKKSAWGWAGKAVSLGVFASAVAAIRAALR